MPGPIETQPFPAQGGPRFPARTRDKGVALFDAGRAVALSGVTVHGQVCAQPFRVYGGEPYEVLLYWDADRWEGSCTCPAFERWGPCKHVVAAALAAAEWPQAEAFSVAFGALEEEDLSPSTAAAPGPASASPGRGDWRALLRAVEPRLLNDPAGLAPEDGEAPARIDAVVAFTPLSDDGLLLHAVYRSLRKDGTWGTPLEVRSGRALEEAWLSREDQELARLLAGATADPWFYEPDWEDDRRGPSVELAAVLLPRLARRRRLHLYDAVARDAELDRGDLERLARQALRGSPTGDPLGTELLTLGLDDGGPWRRELFVEAGEVDGRPSLVLRQRFRRGEERLGPDEVRGVLEEAALFVHGRELARLDPRDAQVGLAPLLHAASRPCVPPEDAAEFARALAPFLGAMLTAAPGLVRATVEPRPLVALHGLGSRTPSWELFVRYGDASCPSTGRFPTALVLADGRTAVRDRAAERGFLSQLDELGLRADPRAPHLHAGPLSPARLEPVLAELAARGWEVRVDGREVRRAGTASLRVASGPDWFDVEGTVDFGGAPVPLPELLQAARSGGRGQGPGRLLHLDDGSLAILPDEWLERWRALELGRVEGDAVRFGQNQGLLLDALLSAREGELALQADAGFQALRDRLRRFGGARPAKEHARFGGTLRAYQREGLGWLRALRELELGGCLADEMGLGKTVQVLAHLQRLHATTRVVDRRPSLVVAPRSLAFQWEAEAARFAPGLVVVDHRGPGRAREAAPLEAADLILTTYGTLRRDAELLASLELDTVVLDEATAIKNASSQAAKAARLLRARHRLALTGTPVENHLGELWSLFEFLNPGMLGRATRFRALLKDAGREDDEGSGFLAAVGAAVAPFLLRRRKEDVLRDLPAKSVETLTVELGAQQRREYDRLRDHYRSLLLADGPPADGEAGGLEGRHFQVLEALLRLRQASCHVGLIDPSRRGEPAAKLEALFEQLGPVLATPGRKALVFSQFTSLLELVRAEVEARGIPYCLLTGRTRKRAEAVARFQEDPTVPLFLISLKAGGHGLNLTAADTVFLLDPWWNPAVEAQAIDRAHRSGQTRPVFAYRLIARDTVEEKVLALQRDKQELADAVLGDERSLLASLTREDLEGLL